MAKFFLTLILISACADPTLANAPKQLLPIVLARGLSRTLALGPGAIHVSNGEIIVARTLGQKIVLTGKAKGRSHLQIGDSTYQVVVVDSSTFLTYESLEKALEKIMGLTLKVDEETVTVQGELLRFNDWIDIRNMTRSRQTRFNFEAKMNSVVEKEALLYFKALLLKNRLGLASLTLSPRATISVNTQDKQNTKIYRELLEPFGFVVQESGSAVTLEPMVEVEIQIAEVRKNFARKLGVQYPSSYQAQLLPAPGTPNGQRADGSSENGMSVMLHAIEQNGNGKILAAPKLLCRSGKEAQFLAGGEFPIKIMNAFTKDVNWKRYGVLLNVKPIADLSGRMSIAVETEISMLDQANAVEGIPGLLTNRVVSHFDLEKSQTIALSGLIKSEIGRSSDGLPFLQRIPILGLLFSSEDFRENRTELIVFVTPRVMSQENLSEPIKMPTGWSDEI